MQPCRRGWNDEVILTQVRRRQDAARELEGGAREPTELVLAKRLLAHVLGDARLGDDGDVQLLRIEHAAHYTRVADRHRGADGGIALLEAPQQFRQAHQREAFVEAQSQHALERIARAEALQHFARGAQDAIGVFDQSVTFGGKAYAGTSPQEERVCSTPSSSRMRCDTLGWLKCRSRAAA